jgi:hypothetical protein
MTPLHVASSYGLLSATKLLLDKVEGAWWVNSEDHSGWTPLHYATFYGHLSVVKLLLDHGAKVNVRDNSGYTPLHWAASHGQIEIAKLLIKYGADVNSENNRGWTPLHMATFHGHVDVVKLLLESGAKPNIKNKDGKTPLDLARKKRNYEVAKIIEEFVESRALSILSIESSGLFVGEWGKILIKARGVGKARISVEGHVEYKAPVSIDLSGEGIIELPVKPKAIGEVPVTVTIESLDMKVSKPVLLRVGTKIESFIKWLLGRPVQLNLPVLNVKRLEKSIRLGGLECRGYLSTGGFATVVVCMDDLGISHAVKMPNQVFLELLASEKPTRTEIDLKPFLREVDVLRNASMHPCIVHFESFLDSPPALVFELCRCSLRDVLKQGGLGSVKAAEVIVQIADALVFLHSKGYIHGDIKPENILFTSDGVPKLSDFNTAKAISAISRTKPGFTPGYAAPEQIRGGKLSEKTDSWALGLVLYEAIFGEPLMPMDEVGYEEALVKLERGEITLKTTGIREIDELVKSCLSINPNERPSAQQIRDTLANYLAKQLFAYNEPT